MLKRLCVWFLLASGCSDDPLPKCDLVGTFEGSTLLSVVSIGSVVVVGGKDGEFFRSADGGSSWTRGQTGVAEDVTSLRANAGWVYGVSRSFLLRSGDDGMSWEAKPRPYLPASDTLIVTASGRIIMDGLLGPDPLGTQRTMAYSDDQGATWDFRPRPPEAIGNIEGWTLDSRVIIAGACIGNPIITPGYALYSDDNGDSWIAPNEKNCTRSGPPAATSLVGGSNKVYALYYGFSGDRGESWKILRGLPPNQYKESSGSAVQHVWPTRGEDYAWGDGLFRTRDPAQGWTQFACGDPDVSARFAPIAVSGDQATAYYVGVHGYQSHGAVYRVISQVDLIP